MTIHWFRVTPVTFIFFCFLFCSPYLPAETADRVYTNGAVYTGNKSDPWVETIAVRNDRFIYAGSKQGVKNLQGANTAIIDLQGRMVMPGLHDMHIHILQGGEDAVFGCRFSENATPAEITKIVKTCIDNNKHETRGWIVGGNWNAGYLDKPGEFNRTILDQVAPGIPVLLWNNSHHDVIVNSKALELLGITADTPDPQDGQIVKDSQSGEPNGLLIEKAAFVSAAKIPFLTTVQSAEAIKYAQAMLNKFGVLAVKDAGAYSHSLKAYKYLDDRDELTMRVAASILWQSGVIGPIEDTMQVFNDRDTYQGKNIKTEFVKMFLDGAPPARTAAFLDPYVPDLKYGNDYRGLLMVDNLYGDLLDLDSKGITVKMHASGDASVRAALDAVEQVRKQNGNSGLRHEISHASFIHPDDIPRFRQLNVMAEYSPVIWHPHPVLDYLDSFLKGGRVAQMWPIKSVLQTGAHAIAGSDWPTVGADLPNPWLAIEAMVTRMHPTGDFPGRQNPEQAIPLEDALEIYTMNGARAMRLEKITGSIEKGKSADFIVLEQNLFEIPPDRISDTKIWKAVFRGKTVYEH